MYSLVSLLINMWIVYKISLLQTIMKVPFVVTQLGVVAQLISHPGAVSVMFSSRGTLSLSASFTL